MKTVSVAEETAGESAYRSIRGDIIGGLLAPRSRLLLGALKERYAASISTLREILYRLSAEELVSAEGLRGFEVAAVTKEEFQELAAVRELLEGHAFQTAFRKGGLEWEGRLVGAHHKLERMEQRLMTGDTRYSDDWKRYDREFHHTLVSACDSTEFLEAYSAIFDRYQRYQIVAIVFRGEEGAREHQELMESALERNPDRALSILRQHISACVSHTLATGQLSSRSAEAGTRLLPDGSESRRTVGETAWRRLRVDILSGRLQPNQKLKLGALKESYGASVTTLRETLNRLASEGLVVAEGQRGFEVAPVSVQNLLELAELRVLVEGRALQDSFAAGNVDWEASVLAAYHKLKAIERDNSSNHSRVAEMWRQCETDFHNALVAACGSQVLIQLHNALFDKHLRYQMISFSSRGKTVTDENRELLDCALRRDASGAREILQRHVEEATNSTMASGTIAA